METFAAGGSSNGEVIRPSVWGSLWYTHQTLTLDVISSLSWAIDDECIIRYSLEQSTIPQKQFATSIELILYFRLTYADLGFLSHFSKDAFKENGYSRVQYSYNSSCLDAKRDLVWALIWMRQRGYLLDMQACAQILVCRHQTSTPRATGYPKKTWQFWSPLEGRISGTK